MFNLTVHVTRRAAALVASTIVVGMAAKTTSAFALEPQPAAVPQVSRTHPAALPPAAVRGRVRAGGPIRRRRAPATVLRRTHDLTVTRTGADRCS